MLLRDICFIGGMFITGVNVHRHIYISIYTYISYIMLYVHRKTETRLKNHT